jgi:membrane-bound serine protease (ClpP class)
MDIVNDFLLNPNVAYLGLVLAFLLTIMALLVPGTGLIEVFAFFSILYAVYAIANLTINPYALLLLVVGVIPFIIALRRSHKRIYLIFSLIALIIGSSYLFVGEGLQPAVNPILAVFVSVFLTGFIWIVSSKVLGSENLPPAHNPDQLIGETGESTTTIHDEGTVQIKSELWSARSEETIPSGAHVRVTGRDGFTLVVVRIQEEQPADSVSTGQS